MSFMRHILPGAARAEAVISIGAAFDQPWCIQPLRMVATFEEVRHRFAQLAFKELREFLGRREPEVKTGDELIQVVDDVGHIPIQGQIFRDAGIAELMRWFGMAAIGTDELRRAVDRATVREDIKSVHFDIDSPGGQVAGLTELSDDIFALRQVKPTSGHARRIIASAAYHVGSQVKRLTAERGTLVGSIGTVVQIVDVTKALADDGVKVEYISTGIHKTAGAPGTSLTKEQRAEIQREVDDLQADFDNDIVRGRSMTKSEVAQVADGRVFHAPRALGHKLIDAVESEDVAHLAAIPKKASEPPSKVEPVEPPEGEGEALEDETQSQDGGISAATQTDVVPEATSKGANQMAKPTDTKVVATTIEQALAQVEEANAAKAEAEKERDQHKATADQHKATADLYLTRLNGAKKDEITQVLDDLCGVRFEPAERAQFASIAEQSFKDDPKAFRALLERMPQLTKPEPTAKTPEQNTDETKVKTVTETDKKLAAKMGIDVQALARMDDLVEVTHDGYAIYSDGTKEKIERAD